MLSAIKYRAISISMICNKRKTHGMFCAIFWINPYSQRRPCLFCACFHISARNKIVVYILRFIFRNFLCFTPWQWVRVFSSPFLVVVVVVFTRAIKIGEKLSVIKAGRWERAYAQKKIYCFLMWTVFLFSSHYFLRIHTHKYMLYLVFFSSFVVVVILASILLYFISCVFLPFWKSPAFPCVWCAICGWYFLRCFFFLLC